jgi:hypothetical protein
MFWPCSSAERSESHSIAPGELDHLRDLALRYADRHPDLADVCLIRMSEIYCRHMLITVDEDDFRVYRRNKREAIPLVDPPRTKK